MARINYSTGGGQSVNSDGKSAELGIKMPTAEQKLIPIGDRKLMPMGNGGLVVTVPRIWARFHQLEVGDLVELEIGSGGELRIRPKELPEDTGNEG